MHLEELLTGSIFQSGQPNITTVALTGGLCAAVSCLGAAAVAATAADRQSTAIHMLLRFIPEKLAKDAGSLQYRAWKSLWHQQQITAHVLYDGPVVVLSAYDTT
jgi:hypothetical protein